MSSSELVVLGRFVPKFVDGTYITTVDSDLKMELLNGKNGLGKGPDLTLLTNTNRILNIKKVTGDLFKTLLPIDNIVPLDSSVENDDEEDKEMDELFDDNEPDEDNEEEENEKEGHLDYLIHHNEPKTKKQKTISGTTTKTDKERQKRQKNETMLARIKVSNSNVKLPKVKQEGESILDAFDSFVDHCYDKMKDGMVGKIPLFMQKKIRRQEKKNFKAKLPQCTEYDACKRFYFYLQSKGWLVTSKNE